MQVFVKFVLVVILSSSVLLREATFKWPVARHCRAIYQVTICAGGGNRMFHSSSDAAFQGQQLTLLV